LARREGIGSDANPVEPDALEELAIADPAAINNGSIEATGLEIATIADRLRRGKADGKTCSGISGFTDGDWEQLDQLFARVQKEAAKAEPSQR
jgi:hypothetical protein